MPVLRLPALLKRLGDGPPCAVVFLHGEEEYLREGAVRSVIELLVDPATRDFNLDQVRGGDVTPEALASLLATPPMMAERRAVVVREAQGLSPRAREVVESVLAQPPPGLFLVLVATIPGGSKAKFYDTVRSSALSVEFAAVDPHDLPAWLVEQSAAVHGVEIELEAARALAAAIGPQLGVLAAELDKASAYVGDRKRITLADIEAVGGYIPRTDRWAWLDQIGERRIMEALAELPDLLDSGESGVGLVLGMGSHLLRLGILVAGGRDAFDRHLPPQQRWLFKRLQPQARRWTTDQIDLALTELLRTDRLLKSASLTDRQALEELLLRLAALHAPAGSAPRPRDPSGRPPPDCPPCQIGRLTGS
jgi:DNA polymerase III subunit delta